ncbi:hypothetical protein [Streptomyces broussonetiae]|uniref:hypothetical protein n=1 Tax=Streptomyces broussonetiae TaxID=2686304 RepID=UPI0035DE288B
MRLVVAFTLVTALTALTAAATGALTFREARTGVLQQSQDTVINMLRGQITRLAPDFGHPPTELELRRFAAGVARAEPSGTWRVLAEYRDLSAASAPGDPFDELTPAVREAVDSSMATVFQRVGSGGHTSLVVGMSVAYAAPEGTGRQPSGRASSPRTPSPTCPTRPTSSTSRTSPAAATCWAGAPAPTRPTSRRGRPVCARPTWWAGPWTICRSPR